MKFLYYPFAALLIFVPFNFISQIETYSITNKSNPNITWIKHYKSNNILIEYSFQENNPKRGYKGEFLMLKVSNLSNNKKQVSWDFSSVFENGKCLNCNSKNQELHFEANIPENSYMVGNLNNYYKGPLVIFHRFTDENYLTKNTVKWNSFDLNNLIIK